MWRDEWHAWLVGRFINSLYDIIKLHENQPKLWHFLLWGLSHAGLGPWSMQALHIVIATCTVHVAARFAPFSRTARVLFTFGYFPFFEYAVLRRHYALEVMLFLVGCTLFCARRQRPVALAGVIALMCQVNPWALALGPALWLGYCYQWSRDPGRAKLIPLLATGSVIVAAGVLLSFLQVGTPAGGPLDTRRSLQERLGQVTRSVFGGYCPLPQTGYLPHSVGRSQFWNTLLLDRSPVAPFLHRFPAAQGIIPAILLVGLPLFVARHPASLVSFVAGSLALLAMFAWFPGNLRHYGHIYFIWITAFWISELFGTAGPRLTSDQEPLNLLDRARKPVFFVILMIQFLAGMVAAINEYRATFSGSRAIAEIIRNKFPADVPIVGDPDYTSLSIAGYLDRPIFYIGRQEWGTYTVDDARRVRASLETEQLSQRLPQFLARQRRDVLLVVSYPLEISDPQMQFIARNDFTLIDDEQYSLVAVRYQPRFPLQSAVGNSIPGDQ
jgi:hypothetical protein